MDGVRLRDETAGRAQLALDMSRVALRMEVGHDPSLAVLRRPAGEVAERVSHLDPATVAARPAGGLS